MSVNAVIAQNQHKVNLALQSIALLLGLGVSPLILLWVDRPAFHRTYESPGFRQAIAWVMLCASWGMVMVLWFAAPFAAVVAWAIGLLSTARRVAGSSGAPVEMRDFIRAMRLPDGWGWAWLAIIGFPLLSGVYNTVRLDFIPSWARDLVDNAAILSLLAGVGVAVWAGVRAARDFRALLADQANLRVAVAAILGTHPRVFEERQASFHRSGTSLVIEPHSTLELSGVETRLEATALGEQYEVAEKSYARIVLVPISDASLDRLRAMRESGGLVEASTDLRENAPLAIEPADDDFDPWGAMDTAPAASDDGGVITFDEGAWT